ncbi:MAG: ASKHA domain-containing protein [Planctomycetota bacterium]|jgi:uncharacterized 2Fe-2S/4Fe-4S cluster protein (DUF4445 family)|nr:ASKHA domain-containing protein [Planctomycetota bacterium]
MPKIQLDPLGVVIELATGASINDALFAHGVEFPCGAKGRCRGCRVRVTEGAAPMSAADQKVFSDEELATGWRLACTMRATSDLRLQLAAYTAPVLADETAFTFTPRDGLGIAIDLGTTTLVAQLLDLSTGAVLAVRSGLNPQAVHGADLMSRLDKATQEGGLDELAVQIHQALAELIAGFADERHPLERVQRAVVVGNTAMHHLFARRNCDSLARYPFESSEMDLSEHRADELGWPLPPATPVFMLPDLGGYVGSDLLAGILATRLHESEHPVALLDLGTNGEVVLGDRHGIQVTSTAAGPAFEGAGIQQGMRASTGAIHACSVHGGVPSYQVIGGGAARGICGSGLVDIVATCLDLGLVEASGRMAHGVKTIPLRDEVVLDQTDIRQLQLAKGAIAGGLAVLLARRGLEPKDLGRVYLAGAFGNYVNQSAGCRIGLLTAPPEHITTAGNTALLGAKLALFEDDLAFTAIRSLVSHVSLKADMEFQDRYVEAMSF